MNNLDEKLAIWIRTNIFSNTLGAILSRINRGEFFFLILLPFLWLNPSYRPFWLAFGFTCIAVYCNDRSVLVLKKFFGRPRPLIQVLGKTDSNPDMRHSFPSAHSANSMNVVIVLIFCFGFPKWFLVFPLLAGIGRLLTLHHYFSDVIGGWFLGLVTGCISVATWFLFVESGIILSLPFWF